MKININIIPFSLKKKNIFQLEPSLKDLFSPYHSYSRVNHEKYVEYLCKKIWKLNKLDSKNIVFLAVYNKKVKGIIAGEFSEWDSNYFGIPIIKILFIGATGKKGKKLKIKKMLINSFIKECSERKIKNLIVRIDIRNHTSLNALQELGFKVMTVEGVNILDRVEKMDNNKMPHVKINPMEERDFNELINISREITSTLKSHYYFNLKLPRKKVQNYYIKNVVNCCKGKNADEVIVGKYKGEVVGFLAYNYPSDFTKFLNLKKASVVLFALAESFRGKNFSSAFLYRATKYILNKVDFITGEVYLHNKGMVRLLAKFNSSPFCQYLYCLHKWF